MGRTLAAWLLLAIPPVQEPVEREPVPLVSGVPVTIDLSTEDRDPTSGLVAVDYEYQTRGACSVFIHATSDTSGITLSIPRSSLRPDSGSASGDAAVLTIETVDVVAFPIRVEAGGSGSIRVFLSEVATVPRAVEAAERARRQLRSVRKTIGTDEGAHAYATVLRTIDELVSLGEDRSWDCVGLLALAGHYAGDLGLLAEAELTWRIHNDFYLRHLTDDHEDLQAKRLALVQVLERRGRYEEAIPILHQVDSVLVRTVPPENTNRVVVPGGLVRNLALVGRLQEARQLAESHIATLSSMDERFRGELLKVKHNLASILYQTGDWPGAFAVMTELLEEYESRPVSREAHLYLLGNLALVQIEMGKVSEARDLQEAVLEGLLAIYPEDHPRVEQAQLNLGVTLKVTGDRERAKELFESILESRTRRLGRDHPDTLTVRFHLVSLCEDPHEVPGQLLEILSARKARLGFHHPSCQATRRALAPFLAIPGSQQKDQLEKVLLELVSTCRHRIGEAVGASRRERGALVRGLTESLATLVELGPETDRAKRFEHDAFELIEGMRALVVLSPRVPTRAELTVEAASLRAEWMAASRRLARSLHDPDTPDPNETAALIRRVDELEASLRKEVNSGGFVSPVDITVEGVASSLPEGSAAVAYRRLGKRESPLPVLGAPGDPSDSLMASVVGPKGLTVLEIGPIGPLHRLVSEWRAAIGKPLPDPGVQRPGDEWKIARQLRAMVLDPVLHETGEVDTLFVCLDDALHLIDLDSLPTDEPRELLGSRPMKIHLISSFAEIPEPAQEAVPKSEFVGVGGVDYSSRDTPFLDLPGTLEEVEDLHRRFRARGVEPRLFTGARATTRGLEQAAQVARYLHVSTHGFFNRMDVMAWGDRVRRSESVVFDGGFVSVGMAPSSLCGLAMADADVTALEIATWNLHGCELAVVAACDGSAGLRRAGQGTASLQSSLHAAGVESVITALWPMDHEATLEFIEAFYAGLLAGSSPREALWAAKELAYGSQKHTRDWAGWVLTHRR